MSNENNNLESGKSEQESSLNSEELKNEEPNTNLKDSIHENKANETTVDENLTVPFTENEEPHQFSQHQPAMNQNLPPQANNPQTHGQPYQNQQQPPNGYQQAPSAGFNQQSGQQQPPYPNGYPNPAGQQPPYVPQYGVPAPRIRNHKDFTIAYAFLVFLGIFGGHKFYLGQTAHGIAYLGLWLISAVLLTSVGIGYLMMLGLYLLMYTDARTIPEQVERTNMGEDFTIAHISEFFKKGFSPIPR